jgi:hypothetical protein
MYLPALAFAFDPSFQLSANSSGLSEFLVVPKADVIGSYPGIRLETELFDAVAIFTYGGNKSEYADAVCSAAFFATVTDGMFYDPHENKLYSAKQAVERAIELNSDIRRET